MKTRLLQVLWVASLITLLGFVVFGLSIGHLAIPSFVGAIVAAVGLSVVYVFTGSFKLPTENT